ncbi:SRPBCC domain-containing protein [Soonwooa sp.]|uniref:SRPBCC family protein n=1 Tax=Soonwooa sp. TaxID=1938592 RepID=UPI002613047F|nr:SRPBCC domain-containing protein [Soonwooa sp.]
MKTNVEKEVIINASIDKVWKALTNKEEMKHWYFDIPDFSLEKDAIFNFFEPGGQNKFWHRCQVEEVIPNQIFKHTWEHPDFSKAITHLTWKLSEKDGQTIVNLNHDNLDGLAEAGDDFKVENYNAGWTEILKNLKKYLENME